MRGPERSRNAAYLARNDPRTYVAQVGEHNAEWLLSLDEPSGITRKGKAAVTLTAAAVAYMQQRPYLHDCHINAAITQIFFEGEPYPVSQC
ncbi:hypothetical protein [Amycolatopsis sp. cmx-11-12]|uniref:hypothetical protein n=1 Tax=Amycolatopsis sp. cmx-11-12 TaxID=2785795 RepID=UPI003916E98A